MRKRRRVRPRRVGGRQGEGRTRAGGAGRRVRFRARGGAGAQRRHSERAAGGVGRLSQSLGARGGAAEVAGREGREFGTVRRGVSVFFSRGRLSLSALVTGKTHTHTRTHAHALRPQTRAPTHTQTATLMKHRGEEGGASLLSPHSRSPPAKQRRAHGRQVLRVRGGQARVQRVGAADEAVRGADNDAAGAGSVGGRGRVGVFSPSLSLPTHSPAPPLPNPH